MPSYPSTHHSERLPFSIPFHYDIFVGNGTTTVEIWRRDPLLTFSELINYLKHLPINHSQLDFVPSVAYIPIRYRFTDSKNNRVHYREPFSPRTFYTYIKEFELRDGRLFHVESGFPVCTSSSFDTFRIYARDVANTFLNSQPQSPYHYNKLVQQRAQLYFVDGETFAEFFINGSPLPCPSELGLLGGDNWTMLTAATANDASTRDSLLRGVYEKAVDNTLFAPFPSTYNIQDGKVVTGQASPAQGAAFGLLAMSIDHKLAGIPTVGSQEKAVANLSIGAQLGIGMGVASLVLMVLVFLLWWRQRRHTQAWCPSREWFRESSDVPGNGPELAEYRIEPYTTQKAQLQHQYNAAYTSRKRYEFDPDLLRQTREQADLELTSRAEDSEDVVIRTAYTRSGSPSSSARGHADDTRSLRNTVEHLRRTILELQSRVYGPPPSYRAESPPSSLR
ncbi:hypothetical protein VNI00_018482 [Paramarasmius palmivorus]|uniref:Glutaminase A central domain-containing protein n=1 Tax=Paramarasmius palmivorus TaxID=297713 RepID=A0AAW0AXJ8_9AGAR